MGVYVVYAPPFFTRRIILKKNKPFVEIHKFSVIEPLEETYPETGQKLIRPKINFVRAILLTLLVLISIGLVSLGLLTICPMFEWYQAILIPYGIQYMLLYFIGLLICLLLFSKHIVIFTIKLYQRYGRYEIRCRCLFVPNCSEYMILAIKKYGLIKGLKKGRDRYNRCHAPNGGIDYP